MVEYHPNRPLTYLRWKSVLLFHVPILSQNEVSDNPGAVQPSVEPVAQRKRHTKAVKMSYVWVLVAIGLSEYGYRVHSGKPARSLNDLLRAVSLRSRDGAVKTGMDVSHDSFLEPSPVCPFCLPDGRIHVDRLSCMGLPAFRGVPEALHKKFDGLSQKVSCKSWKTPCRQSEKKDRGMAQPRSQGGPDA